MAEVYSHTSAGAVTRIQAVLTAVITVSDGVIRVATVMEGSIVEDAGMALFGFAAACAGAMVRPKPCFLHLQ